jgi:glycosyltransferase involved in cell wall biosynthesis
VDSDVSHGRAVDVDGVQVYYCRSRWFRRLYFSTDVIKQLGMIAKAFDVIHLHSVFLFPTWAGAREALRIGVPYVLSPRGMLVRELIDRRSRALKHTWIRFVERGNLARAAQIHLTSTEERRALIELGLALAPTSIIPNGVDLPPCFSPDDVSDDVRKLVAEGFDVLSFGRISWKKGLERLIGAMTELPNARVLIAGNDEEGFANKLRAVATEWGVGDRVLFLPRQIVGADKEALFAAARLFALPSLSENFGNVVTEAMIRALPVLVTERVGAAEIVRASGAGVVVGTDRQHFSAALSALLQSDQRLAAAGAAGASYARDRLSWQGVARLFRELYGKISREDRDGPRDQRLVDAARI